MQIGAYVFTPRWFPTAAAIALLPVLVSLGVWQLQRADEKRALEELLSARLHMPLLNVRKTADITPLQQFRSAALTGRFDSGSQYLLDNKVYRGRAGYQVFTPLRLADGGAVLVSRGWVAPAATRARLPALPTPEGVREVRGVLSMPPGKLLKLGDQAAAPAWPRVVQQIDISKIQAQLGYPLAPLLLQIEANDPAAYAQEWQPYVDSPEKHVSYAVQWFAMAAIVMALYAALNTRRMKT